MLTNGGDTEIGVEGGVAVGVDVTVGAGVGVVDGAAFGVTVAEKEHNVDLAVGKADFAEVKPGCVAVSCLQPTYLEATLVSNAPVMPAASSRYRMRLAFLGTERS